jgi:hypothetical protein
MLTVKEATCSLAFAGFLPDREDWKNRFKTIA